MNEIFTRITEKTAYGALDRALADLDVLTNGQAAKAIECVAEINELKAICESIEEEKKMRETRTMAEEAAARG